MTHRRGDPEPRDMRRFTPQRAEARGFRTSAKPPSPSSPSVLPNAPRAERLKGSKLCLQEQKTAKATTKQPNSNVYEQLQRSLKDQIR